MIVTAAPLDYTRPVEARSAYLAYLAAVLPAGVLCLTEWVRGRIGTRVHGIGGTRVRRKRWRSLGRVGAHRAVAVGVVDLAGVPVRVLAVHGLHRGTVGHAAAWAWLLLLAGWTRALTLRRRLWVVAGDLNTPHRRAARLLGATAVGEGVVLVAAGPGLGVELVAVHRTGMRKGWTNHPAVVGRVSRQPRAPRVGRRRAAARTAESSPVGSGPAPARR